LPITGSKKVATVITHLIVLGACTALRISDLLKLTWADVYDEKRKKFRTHITVTEQKTGKQRKIALNEKAINVLKLHSLQSRGVFLFANDRNGSAISRTQAWRIIKTAVEAVGIDGCIGCHSLRKTFGYHAWKSGASPVMLMEVYNHTSFDVTRRYLGITQDDTDKIYLNAKLF
jgi:integrase